MQGTATVLTQEEIDFSRGFVAALMLVNRELRAFVNKEPGIAVVGQARVQALKDFGHHMATLEKVSK